MRSNGVREASKDSYIDPALVTGMQIGDRIDPNPNTGIKQRANNCQRV
jgi:hypothetical protein